MITIDEKNKIDNLINNLAAEKLGKITGYPKKYDPLLLVAIPRKYNRATLKYHEQETFGLDYWRAFEVNCANSNGVPLIGILSFAVSSNSKCIVESKSLKLYLNSIAYLKFEGDYQEVKLKLINLVKRDLENLLESSVEVCFFINTENEIKQIKPKGEKMLEHLNDFKDLASFLPANFLPANVSTFATKKVENSQLWYSTWLKSRCRITDQPDFGNIYVYLEPNKDKNGVKNGIDEQSFASWLILQQDLNHFHEEMCELIYSKILDEIKPKKLSVCCFYTRRGGIDINPIRSNFEDDLLISLLKQGEYFTPIFRQ